LVSSIFKKGSFGMDFDNLISFIDSAADTFIGVLWLIFIYYFFVSIFGWVRRREQPAEKFPLKNKFAIIISAHNEETVIGGAIRSLKKINYPQDMYDIFVIADNCCDSTAKVAREWGAKVYERTDSLRKGKGYALEWMFGNLFEMEKKYDAICILDADNLVSKNFFLEMNKQLILGHKVIQGYLDSKNPHDSWVSGNYSIAYWISNRMFQLPRHYLGLNCALGGTGFVMATSVLKEIGWGATCLTEDLEFSMKLVLKGMKVSWSHNAVVYDEKPLRMAQSWKQRKRWMQGHCDCAFRYLADLIKLAVLKRDMVAFDSALYLIQPFVIVANGIAAVYSILNILINKDINTYANMNTLLFLLLVLFVTYVNIVFVFVEGKLTKKIALYFITFPVYSLTWIPIIIAGFLDRNKREWVHTLHTRALDINDLESLEVEKVG
jgi:cellulose synthase/poly-beta-1,6-N-acetylglucosamine synthase-like glycosyltransferase